MGTPQKSAHRPQKWGGREPVGKEKSNGEIVGCDVRVSREDI